MFDQTPLEKLQPCLLDRLTDEDPQNTQEGRNQRVISLEIYKRGVLRDLGWLFSASAHLPEEGGPRFRLSDYPQAFRSVINFGTRQLFGLFAPNMAELERRLTEAILDFEPRIVPSTLIVTASTERNLVSFSIQGDLWANPVPETLFIKTKLDLETGDCVVEG